MSDLAIALIVAAILASPTLWLLLPAFREDKEVRLHPYTLRKMKEREYRHFDDGGWDHTKNPRRNRF